MADRIKIGAITFLTGLLLGLIINDQIILRSIIKDCGVLHSFRIGDIAFACNQLKR
jgi:hypothetical protein